MRQVVATALVLLLLLFLFPLALLRGAPLAAPAPSSLPTGTLPLDRTPRTSPPVADASAQGAGAGADAARTLTVACKGGTQTLSLRDYLWGVVAAEMPASFAPQALQAQAVAARTYAVSKLGQIAKHPGADLCDDISCCQAYLARADALQNWGANGAAYAAKIDQAVAETDGLVVLYDGAPIQAVFFSSAAGKTVDAVEVWGNDVPYLQSVPSPEGDEVPGYHSTVSVTPAHFQQTIAAAHPDAVFSANPADWCGGAVLNSAGGVETLTVGGVPVRGSELRQRFALRSTSFTVSATADAIVFSVTGYGHGVGMSQYGANALAAQGLDFRAILQRYYTGVTIAPCP